MSCGPLARVCNRHLHSESNRSIGRGDSSRRSSHSLTTIAAHVDGDPSPAARGYKWYQRRCILGPTLPCSSLGSFLPIRAHTSSVHHSNCWIDPIHQPQRTAAARSSSVPADSQHVASAGRRANAGYLGFVSDFGDASSTRVRHRLCGVRRRNQGEPLLICSSVISSSRRVLA